MVTAMTAEVIYRVASVDDLRVVVQLLAELVDELGPAEMADRVKPKLTADIEAALRSEMVCIYLAYADGETIGLSRGDVLTTDPIFRLRVDHR